jgi:hypothetical protein
MKVAVGWGGEGGEGDKNRHVDMLYILFYFSPLGDAVRVHLLQTRAKWPRIHSPSLPPPSPNHPPITDRGLGLVRVTHLPPARPQVVTFSLMNVCITEAFLFQILSGMLSFLVLFVIFLPQLSTSTVTPFPWWPRVRKGKPTRQKQIEQRDFTKKPNLLIPPLDKL